MKIPVNRWCDGSGRPPIYNTKTKKGECPVCGYTYVFHGITPKHRPKIGGRDVSTAE